MTIQDELRATRAALGLSLTAMGARLGADRQTVWRWEQGLQAIRHPRMLRALLAELKKEETMNEPTPTEAQEQTYLDIRDEHYFGLAWDPSTGNYFCNEDLSNYAREYRENGEEDSERVWRGKDGVLMVNGDSVGEDIDYWCREAGIQGDLRHACEEQLGRADISES